MSAHPDEHDRAPFTALDAWIWTVGAVAHAGIFIGICYLVARKVWP